jgi:hypothetical protein
VHLLSVWPLLLASQKAYEKDRNWANEPATGNAGRRPPLTVGSYWTGVPAPGGRDGNFEP